MVNSVNTRFFHYLICCVAGLCLAACAIPAPVQEMSNARQSLQAAKEVRAQHYVPVTFTRAQRLLDDAARELEKGEYILARDYALEAKLVATRARQAAISLQKK